MKGQFLRKPQNIGNISRFSWITFIYGIEVLTAPTETSDLRYPPGNLQS